MLIGSTVFVQLMADSPIGLQWAAHSPLMIAALRGIRTPI